jgi:hemerythrin-like domain-containing protein
MKRSSELRPLSSEHHQALLVAFQLKKGLAGHPEAAGAPKDLPGLLNLARRFDEQLFRTHARAEEELLGTWLTAGDMARLRAEHQELTRHLEAARDARAVEQRAHLSAYADLLDRHVRWEERELFPRCESSLTADDLSVVGHELEKRLVIAGRAVPRRS